MMLPPLCRYICRSAARVVRNAPSRWMASRRFQSAYGSSSSGATIWIPALLTSTSMRPKAATTAAVPDSTSDSLVTSMAMAMACSPERSSSSAAAGPPVESRSAITTRAPAWTKVRAISLPIPLAAPVTIATLSLRFIHSAPAGSLPSVLREIEGQDALEIVRPFEDLGVTERAHRVVIACAAVVLHAEARELVILRVSLVLLGVVDELDEITHLGGGARREEGDFRDVPQLCRELLQQARDGVAQLLGVPETVGGVARAARVLNLLLPRHHLGHGARHPPAPAPQVDLEGECVTPRLALEHPLQRGIRHQAAVPVELALDLDRGEARR